MQLARGFTLIEVMIVIAILAIITAVAAPLLDNQKRKGYRSDAIIALTQAVQRQERWRTENGTYTSDVTKLTSTGTAASPEGKYSLAVSNVTSETYTISATPAGPQAQDTDCAQFSVTHTGIKSAKNSANANTSTKCWGS